VSSQIHNLAGPAGAAIRQQVGFTIGGTLSIELPAEFGQSAA